MPKIKFIILFFIIAVFIAVFTIYSNLNPRVKGEIFYAAGGEGSFVISRMPVKFFKKDRIGDIISKSDIPDFDSIIPDAETVSDDDGKFEINLPAGEYIVFAHGQRKIVGKTKNLKWVVLANLPGRDYSIILCNLNLQEE